MESDIISKIITEFPQTAVLVYFIWNADKRATATLAVMSGMVNAMLDAIKACCDDRDDGKP